MSDHHSVNGPELPLDSEPAVKLAEVIDTIRRPPGPVRVGERRSDMWLVRLHIGVLCLLATVAMISLAMDYAAWQACTGR